MITITRIAIMILIMIINIVQWLITTRWEHRWDDTEANVGISYPYVIRINECDLVGRCLARIFLRNFCMSRWWSALVRFLDYKSSLSLSQTLCCPFCISDARDIDLSIQSLIPYRSNWAVGAIPVAEPSSWTSSSPNHWNKRGYGHYCSVCNAKAKNQQAYCDEVFRILCRSFCLLCYSLRNNSSLNYALFK